MAPGWDRVLTVFADGAFAFRKDTRRGGAFYRRGAFPTASRHWFHLRRSRSAEPVQTERNEISGVEALRYARSLCAPAWDSPFHPPLPRGRAFSPLADFAEAKSGECRAAICLLACDKSILLADVRDTISDPRTFVARTHAYARASAREGCETSVDSRTRTGHVRGIGEIYRDTLVALME
jgi:hypothetical protein